MAKGFQARSMLLATRQKATAPRKLPATFLASKPKQWKAKHGRWKAEATATVYDGLAPGENAVVSRALNARLNRVRSAAQKAKEKEKKVKNVQVRVRVRLIN